MNKSLKKTTTPPPYSKLLRLDQELTNSQNDQLPVGLIAQLVEHCAGITEFMGWVLVPACFFFFRVLLSQPFKFCTQSSVILACSFPVNCFSFSGPNLTLFKTVNFV